MKATTRDCAQCGGPFGVDDPAARVSVCPACAFVAAIVGDDGTTALRVDTDGRASAVRIAGTDTDRLDALQAATGGGYVEVVRVTPIVDVWCDEDGRTRGAQPNRLGSAVVESVAGAALNLGFVGPVLFTGRSGDRTTGLHAVELRRIAGIVEQCGGVVDMPGSGA